MEFPAQIVAARVMPGTSPTVVPCIRILRGLYIASRSGADFKLKLKFVYQNGSDIYLQEDQQDLSSATHIVDFDGVTALYRGSAVSLSRTPDSGTLLVASVKITIAESSTSTLELSEAFTATFTVG